MRIVVFRGRARHFELEAQSKLQNTCETTKSISVPYFKSSLLVFITLIAFYSYTILNIVSHTSFSINTINQSII